jgi:hypothetical protein
VAFADFLQLHVPLGELFGRQVEAVALMGDVVVLAEDLVMSVLFAKASSTSCTYASQIAAREEDAARAIMALQTRLYGLSVHRR